MLWGKETPRIWTRPLRRLIPATSAGFEVIKFAKDILGIDLWPWERWLLIHALELLPNGEFRFRTIILLVARQNGKSLILAILSLWWMYVFGRPLTIGTAQNLDVAEEQWAVAVELASSNPELAREIAHVDRTNGKKALRLVGGQRYKVAASSRRGGRGLSGDLVLLDELREHQSWDAWGAVTKTTMARALAQIWGASNAGDAASVVLRHLRKLAHLALGDPDGIAADDEPPPDGADVDDDTLAIFEWSAPPGAPISDRAAWAQANPSLGYGITERAIIAAMRTDPEWVFRTEVLCQFLEHTADGPFPPGSWAACADPSSTVAESSPIGACVDVSWDRTLGHVAVAGWRDDGTPHIELVASATGVDWITGWLTDPEHPHRSTWPVAVQAKRAPASSLIEDLEDAGVDVLRWDGIEGTEDLYDRVRSADPETNPDPYPGLAHLDQPALTEAAHNAATRPVGDMWAWDRRRSPVDISPLVAATGALWCLGNVGEATLEGALMVEPSIR
ncbi:MAG: terminase [Actinobacteria bacterium]|nr:terminase [Actinomycetota bacterium]